MATFASLTKPEQKQYTNWLISHYLGQQSTINKYQQAESDEDRTTQQSALDAIQAEDISVDGWQASLTG